MDPPLHLKIQHQSTKQNLQLQRLSMVTIPPLAAVHAKKNKKIKKIATLVGTFILHMLFHRKDREPLEERTLQKDVI